MAVQFTKETKAALHSAASAIAPDVLDNCEDNEEFVSLILDSDYVTIYGSQEAACEIAALLQEHGYAAVLEAACALNTYK